MDFSWLTGIFSKLIGIFSPLKTLQQWRIWAELQHWYERFRRWRDWYRDHVQTPMRQMQALQRQLFDQYFRPVLVLIDHIRQITGIVAIFNRRLADRLNFYFLRVESYLLAPFNRATERTNTLARIVDSILTPSGLFDRDGILNTIWRDAALVKSILHNPYSVHPSPTPAPAVTSTSDIVSQARTYLTSGGGDYADDINSLISLGQQTLAEIGGILNGNV